MSAQRHPAPIPDRESGGPSTGDYLLGWLSGRRSLRASTRLSYEIHLRRHLLPHLGAIPLRQLTVDDVERLYDQLLSESGGGLSAATVRRVHATLTTALNAAVRRRLLADNPAAFVDLPAVVRPRLQVWTELDLTRFLEHVDRGHLGPLFVVLAHTGMRRGEVVGLRWIDVDLEQRWLRVEQQVISVAGRLVIGPPKTGNGRRCIPVASTVLAALRRQAVEQRRARDDAGPRWTDTGHVFTTAVGDVLDPTRVSRQFELYAGELGLPRIRLHDLRHTSATLGLASGESLFEVSRRLGHSSISITADIYGHVHAATARAAAERLARRLQPGTPHRGTVRG